MKEVMQLVWTGIWANLEVVEVESREGNGRNDKRKLKNQIFPFHIIMRNRTKGGIMLQVKRELSSWFRIIMWKFCMIMWKFRTIMRNAPGRCKLLLLHFLFRTIMRNCLSSCEMTILLLNSRLLVNKLLEDLLDDAKCPLDLDL